MKTNNKAFTLIELMITVAIMGILAAIAIPKFADLIRKANEGKTKGHLSSLRSAINIYYSDNLGFFPVGVSANNSAGLQNALVSKYAGLIPDCYCPGHHPKSAGCNFIDSLAGMANPCTGSWAYVGNQAHEDWGRLIIECAHNDMKENVWSSY